MSLRTRDTVTIRRYTEARADTGPGRTVRTLADTFPIRGNVQPLSARRRELLPEGKRTAAAYRLSTSATTLQAGDRFEWLGEELEIHADSTWKGPIAHGEYTATKVLEE